MGDTAGIVNALGTSARAVGAVSSGIAGRRANLDLSRSQLEQAEEERQLAALEQTKAGIQVDRIRDKGERTAGSQRAEAAAGGVEVNTGSPLLAVLDTIRRSGEDVTMARYSGDLAAWRRETAASDLETESRFSRRRATQSMVGGFMRGGAAVAEGFKVS